jgi:hypothetical protein
VNADTSTPQSWEELVSVTKQTLDGLISRLPDGLRQEALRIGYELRKVCREDAGFLGAYGLPAQLITLYLETIQKRCIRDTADFRHEVEVTYLHEFGHHLGLGEDDLEKRGL